MFNRADVRPFFFFLPASTLSQHLVGKLPAARLGRLTPTCTVVQLGSISENPYDEPLR